ncbi:MAG: hypothetical protein EOM80_05850 [Erysipelotrichia bacterium]|nr:hypothetical protein [Erysipelotrichia bacterium]
MNINRWLWVLWFAMILSMLLRRQADTYMIVALIVLPSLIVLLELHEEIAILKEENKHQRKFVMDRYTVMQERMTDLSNQIEKRLVVDFAEFAKNNPPPEDSSFNPEGHVINTGRKLKKRKKLKNRRDSSQPIDFVQATDHDAEPSEEPTEPVPTT